MVVEQGCVDVPTVVGEVAQGGVPGGTVVLYPSAFTSVGRPPAGCVVRWSLGPPGVVPEGVEQWPVDASGSVGVSSPTVSSPDVAVVTGVEVGLLCWGLVLTGLVLLLALRVRRLGRVVSSLGGGAGGVVVVGRGGRRRPPVATRTAGSDLRIGRHDSWS